MTAVKKLDFRNNCLNLIRLLAALQVFYGHAVLHLKLDGIPILTWLLGLFPGVPVFFLLSGYLIWNSLDRTPNIKNYLTKRVLRLYPEMWCGVALSLLSIIALYDKFVFRDLAFFALTQSTFLQFWTPDSLRDYGVGTPNGSLWTICVILQFYIAAWFLKKRFLKSHTPTMWATLILIGVAINIITPYMQTFLPTVAYKLFCQTLFPYLWIFILGAFLCEYFDRIMPYICRFWWIGLAIYILIYVLRLDISGTYPVLKTALAGTVWIGFSYAFPKLQIKHDISYGIYVYHMVVINIAVHLGYMKSQTAFLIILLLTLILAILSYIFIGYFCKNFKRKLKI